MLGKEVTPVDVEVSNKEQKLTIHWQDEHVSNYPLPGLRRACPCVVCKGGHSHMKEKVDMGVFFRKGNAAANIKDIKQVGTYAIQIFWEDGHNQGLWKWQYLREICPCKECAPEFYTDDESQKEG
jgi:DUF971 family protein